MPSVTVPKEFFIKERRMYSNWRFAFWRELFQNSTDAGARNIRISLVQKDANTIGVMFEDDGHGMTRDVLETVYFRLGATTKNDGATVGGFGRARILTCFSMKNYSIHTLNSLVMGEGGSYEITDIDSRKGCLITLEMDNESFNDIEYALHEYLKMSQLPCNVFVNNNRWTEWSYRYRLTRSLTSNGQDFANVYVNKSAANRMILFRVNGTIMYYQSIRAKAQVIVEINQDQAREVLTANRDGMHTKYADVVNRFLEELAIDTVTSLKPRFTNKGGMVSGKGMFCSVNSKKPDKKDDSKTTRKFSQATGNLSSGFSSGVFGFGTNDSGEGTSVAARSASGVRGPLIAQIMGDTKNFVGTLNFSPTHIEDDEVEKKEIGDSIVPDMPDILIIDEEENPAVRKVIDSYNPKNWVIAETGGKKYKKGGHLYKLLMLWKIACEAAVQSLMETIPSIHQVSWGIGWVFSEDVIARCASEQGGKFLLLNPVDKNGKMKYGLVSKKDRKSLMASAKHEVAHILLDVHDQEFANLLTTIDENYDEKEVFRKMQEAIKFVA